MTLRGSEGQRRCLLAACPPRSSIHPDPGRILSTLKGKGPHPGPLRSLLGAAWYSTLKNQSAVR